MYSRTTGSKYVLDSFIYRRSTSVLMSRFMLDLREAGYITGSVSETLTLSYIVFAERRSMSEASHPNIFTPPLLEGAARECTATGQRPN